MRPTLILTVALCGLLAACGGRGSLTRTPYSAPVLYATGPIQQACAGQRRKEASRARCGCIQAVADQSLSAAYQRRGAGYFSNPALLQEVRQSDSAANERFWQAWKAFGETAAAMCSGT